MSDLQQPWELEGGYSAALFKAQGVVTEQDVLELWTSEAELDRDEATRRLDELLLVVICPHEQLVGISTAYLARNERLRAELWHIRMFVSAAHRRRSVTSGMSRIAAECLTHRYLDGAETRGIGMIYEIESEILKQALNQGVTPASNFVFIGVDPAGRDVRVRYFPGAPAPEPG